MEICFFCCFLLLHSTERSFSPARAKVVHLLLGFWYTMKVLLISSVQADLTITRDFSPNLSLSLSDLTDCDDNICMEVSTSTAVRYRKSKHAKSSDQSQQCKCQCLSHIRTFREDMKICVNDIGECSLIPFVSSSIAIDTAERIPFVFLPLKGQIIYPSKELQFTNGE